MQDIKNKTKKEGEGEREKGIERKIDELRWLDIF